MFFSKLLLYFNAWYTLVTTILHFKYHFNNKVCSENRLCDCNSSQSPSVLIYSSANNFSVILHIYYPFTKLNLYIFFQQFIHQHSYIFLFHKTFYVYCNKNMNYLHQKLKLSYTISELSSSLNFDFKFQFCLNFNVIFHLQHLLTTINTNSSFDQQFITSITTTKIIFFPDFFTVSKYI